MPSNIAHPSSDARSAAEDILSLIAVVIEIREGLCSARDGLKNIDEFAGTELHRQLLQIDEVWIPTQDDQPIAKLEIQKYFDLLNKSSISASKLRSTIDSMF